MPERDPADFRPARRESSLWMIVIVVVAALVAGAFWWRSQQQGAPTEATAPESAMPAAPDGAAPAEPPVAVETGPQHPIETPDNTALPKLDDADAQVKYALNELLGIKPVASFLQVDGFVRRFVATVDNLPRERATARVWPVQPAPKRFEVSRSGEIQSIGPDNAARYTPFVLFAESVNTQHAVTLYKRLYPLFQQAYEELGYPGRYFNDRLVAVIDHLLQAPEPIAPVRVTLTEVKGDMSAERPWVRYEFVDPKLETLSAGQKMLVRVGTVNERRLKGILGEFRAQIVDGAVVKK